MFSFTQLVGLFPRLRGVADRARQSLDLSSTVALVQFLACVIVVAVTLGARWIDKLALNCSAGVIMALLAAVLAGGVMHEQYRREASGTTPP